MKHFSQINIHSYNFQIMYINLIILQFYKNFITQIKNNDQLDPCEKKKVKEKKNIEKN